MSDTCHMYEKYASWWHLLSTPEDYLEEATYFRQALEKASPPGRSMLELGSGGGNNASHLKRHFDMTLVDRSANMLENSRQLNPELEHIEGDMRTVRLDCLFDIVFIHDAIMYMLTENDLKAAIKTASVHCKPGGLTLFVPDHFREDYRDDTSHGGHDGVDRAMRYLSWTFDPDPEDTTFVTDFSFMLKKGKGIPEVAFDRHIMGHFDRSVWLRLASECDLEPSVVTFNHSELAPDSYHGILCRKR